MTSPAILLHGGSEIPEGIMDAFITTLCALHDLKPEKIRGNLQYILLNPKCMDLMNVVLQI